MKSSSREIKKWIVSNDHFTPYVAQKNELKILDWKRTSSVVVLDYASIHQDCRRSFLLKLGYKADQKVWQQTHEKIVFFLYHLFLPYLSAEETVFHISHIDQTYSFRAESKSER